MHVTLHGSPIVHVERAPILAVLVVAEEHTWLKSGNRMSASPGGSHRAAAQ
jgi:hypothetical protein